MPYFAYGPTVVTTTRVAFASCSIAPASDESATTSGQSAARAPSEERTCSSLDCDRPPRPIRTSGGALRARYSAVSLPTKPVAP